MNENNVLIKFKDDAGQEVQLTFFTEKESYVPGEHGEARAARSPKEYLRKARLIGTTGGVVTVCRLNLRQPGDAVHPWMEASSVAICRGDRFDVYEGRYLALRRLSHNLSPTQRRTAFSTLVAVQKLAKAQARRNDALARLKHAESRLGKAMSNLEKVTANPFIKNITSVP